MEKICIIGAGIAGMGILRAYEKEKDPKDYQIDIYDKEESFGRGFPFMEDSDNILLNVRPEVLSYDYENEDDFVNWLKENKIDYNEFVPRHVFGTYSKERLAQTIKNTKANVIKSLAVDAHYYVDENKWEIEDEKGEKRLYDRVHLACGQLPQIDPYNLAGNSNYLDDIYPAREKLKDLNKDEPVTIIGTSLSAIDISRYLLEERGFKKIYLFSRSNTFPTTRGKEKDLDIKYFTLENVEEKIQDGIMSFDDFDMLFNKELEALGLEYNKLMNKYKKDFATIKLSLGENEDLVNIQNIFSYIEAPLNLAFYSFTNKDKDRFLDKYDNLIQIFGGPTPQSTGKILQKAVEDGRLEVVDKVIDLEYDKDQGEFNIIVDKITKKDLFASSKWVINATGLDSSLKSVDRVNSFLGRLLDKKYVQVDKYGGLSAIFSSFNVISPKYGLFNNLHAHGVLVSGGVEIRNNSIPRIQKTSHNIIKNLQKK